MAQLGGGIDSGTRATRSANPEDGREGGVGGGPASRRARSKFGLHDSFSLLLV